MVELTQSLQHWLFVNHPDLIAPLMFGHVELLTDEMWAEYVAWCKTEDGQQYLVGGRFYRPESEGGGK